MRGVERISVFLINCFCPPLSVMLIAGPGMDCLINTLLFLAGVIPGHIHGFYISCTYFHRKRKVRKGRYPGARKSFVYSDQVWNGGATNAQVRHLYLREQEEKLRKAGRRKSSRPVCKGPSKGIESYGVGETKSRGSDIREWRGHT